MYVESPGKFPYTRIIPRDCEFSTNLKILLLRTCFRSSPHCKFYCSKFNQYSINQQRTNSHLSENASLHIPYQVNTIQYEYIHIHIQQVENKVIYYIRVRMHKFENGLIIVHPQTNHKSRLFQFVIVI
jgi:hypothetical protein